MAKSIPDPMLTPGRRIKYLALPLLGSALLILVLILISKPTVVEVTVRASEAALTVVPRPEGVPISLLHPAIELQALQWTGAGQIEVTLAAPTAGRVPMQLAETGVVALRAREPFHPDVTLRCPTRLRLLHSRGDRLNITLDPAVCDPGWICEVFPQEDLELSMKGEVVSAREGPPPDAPIRLARDGAAIRFTGGAAPTKLGMRLLFEQQGLMTLRVIDPETGAVSAPGLNLPVALPQERILQPAGDQLVLLERQPIDPEVGLVLTSGLTVRELSFYRRAGDDAESFLLGGSIRFLSWEKPPVALPRGFLLQLLPKYQTFRLEALRMTEEGLELVLWGKPSRIKLGPTPEFMPNQLPSCFLWLWTHHLSKLIVPTLLAVMSAIVALVVETHTFSAPPRPFSPDCLVVG